MIVFQYIAHSFSEKNFDACGKMVAVVMNYNKRGMISAAVKSAFEQDYPCYEILAMDDASCDGSDEEMIDSVKKCISDHPKKALKVTVIVNERNMTTLGQWRQAIMSSNGEWFGMFGGDDVSFSDRMRTTSDIITKHPRAVAVCTNFTNGMESTEPHYERNVKVCDSGDVRSWQEYSTIYGCAAFWRRSVLELDIPMGIMDDFILTWIAAIAHAGTFVWDCEKVTVRYSIGTGVTTEDRSRVDNDIEGIGSHWNLYYAIKRRGCRFGQRVWDEIKKYDDTYGSNRDLSNIVRGYWIASMSEGGWWSRAKSLMMMVFDCKNDYGGYRKSLMRKVISRMITKVLGPVTWVPIYYLVNRNRK